MADMCKACGAPLPAGSGFCPSCGARFESAVAPPPAQVGYAAVPAKKSNTLKIVLIVIAVVVVVGAAGIGILGYIGYRAMHTAGNSISVGQNADVSDSDLGVSIYPGAARNANGSMKMNLAGNVVVRAMYTTNDPASDVISYYQGKLGPSAVAMHIGPVTTLTLSTVDGSEKESEVITVTAVSPTQFVIQHTTNKP